jgi:quinol monooxygenase YgiN
MIVIVVKQPVRPKYSDQWLELVEEFTQATRREPGCISFEWSRSLEDPNEVVLVEVFEDDAAGKAHVESKAFEKATQQLPKWLAGPPKIIHINGVSEGWTGMAEIPSDV